MSDGADRSAVEELIAAVEALDFDPEHIVDGVIRARAALAEFQRVGDPCGCLMEWNADCDCPCHRCSDARARATA